MNTATSVLAGMAGALVILLLLIGGLGLIAGKTPGKLSVARKRGWTSAHMIFVIIYFSGVFGPLLLAVTTTFTNNGGLIYAAHFFIRYFDWYLIIPGAVGSVVTGTWLAARTHWGLTKYYWIMVKWVGNIVAILFGSSVVRIGIDDSLRNTFYGRITFSGGMKRRLAIARALLHDPALIYLDEPTLGVDVQARHVIWDYIRGMKEEGRTVLVTTNYLEEAERLCDRMAIIDHGRLAALDSPAALKARYGSSVVELELESPAPRELADALAAVHDQAAVAALTIPPGFSRAVAADTPVALSVTLDNLNADFATDIRRRLPLAILQFYRARLPQRLPLGWRENDSYARTVGFLPYIAVSLLTVALLIAGLFTGSFGMVREWQHGTMQELRLAPVPGLIVVAGRVGSTFILGLAAALIELVVLWLIGVRPEAWGPVAAVVPLVLLVFVSLGVAAGALLRSPNRTMPLVFGLGLPLFFVSGAFGPISWGTPATALVARVFPVVYANTVLQQAMYGFWVLNTGPAAVWTILAGWAVAAVVAGAWAYRLATAPRDSR